MALCRNPYIQDGKAYGCGQCMPCRFNRQRIWKHRIILEANQYKDNAFVTLTYDDDHLPAGGTLVPKDAQDWLKRLRTAWADAQKKQGMEPSRIRFYLVGEYGDTSFRPHYHAALFNFPACRYSQSTYGKNRRTCCPFCDLVLNTWGKGHVHSGQISRESAGYLAGYVTKKMTSKDDERLQGRYPEFARMSLRPGLAGDALWEISDVLLTNSLERVLEDAPSRMRHAAIQLPLGRYLQRRLREQIGRPAHAPQTVMDKLSAEMLPLRLAAKNSEDNPSLKSRVVEKNLGKIQRVEAKARIFKPRKPL